MEAKPNARSTLDFVSDQFAGGRRFYEAASALLTRFKRREKVKTWGLAVAKCSGNRKAVVAAAGIVQDHDIAGMKGRQKNLLYIGADVPPPN